MRRSFCPTVDRDVCLTPPHRDAVACLHYDPEFCAGHCPLTGDPADEMGLRFIRVTGRPERDLRTRIICSLCGGYTGGIPVPLESVFCPACPRAS